MPNDAVPQPPRAPSSRRAVRLSPLRIVGLLGIVAVVIGGVMLGSAEERSTRIEVGDALRVEASGPVFAYQGQMIAIEVTLTASAATGPVTLRPDDSLLKALRGLEATPPFEVAPDGRPEVTVDRVATEDPVHVTVMGRTRGLGRFQGALEVRLADDTSADVPVVTFVYP